MPWWTTLRDGEVIEIGDISIKAIGSVKFALLTPARVVLPNGRVIEKPGTEKEKA